MVYYQQHLNIKTMLHNEIDKLIADAMKSQNSVKLKTLRMIKSEFVKKEKDGITLTDVVESNILTKMVSQREEAIAQFKSANRTDLVESEALELEVLKSFAPKQATDEEIITETESIIASMETVSMKDMKNILAEVQKKYPTASGKIVSQVVKAHC